MKLTTLHKLKQLKLGHVSVSQTVDHAGISPLNPSSTIKPQNGLKRPHNHRSQDLLPSRADPRALPTSAPIIRFRIFHIRRRDALRQKSIDDALYKLNGLLRKHNKLAYGPQAQRHVAEQVDRLYWAAGERGVNLDVEEWAARGADYR